jgi:phosphate ABC transporter phosphate-binding protein
MSKTPRSPRPLGRRRTWSPFRSGTVAQRSRLQRVRRTLAILAATLVAAAVPLSAAPAFAATNYVPISGAGSSWSSNAIDQWRRNVQQYGMRINYSSTGSTDGRNQFRAGTVDFAVSEIPYGLTDNGVVDTPPSRGYAYMPIVAGGTSLMYNLTFGGKKITGLRLSGEVLAKLFTGEITMWNDKQIAADNPGISLPAIKVVPVVRSDGSGSTAQFTLWMSKEYPKIWAAYTAKAGVSSGFTSYYPTIAGSGFVAQPNSQGVAGYVSQTANVGTITYVEYSYALETGFPVAKVLNKAGYYVEPTASNVAVALLAAKINEDKSSPSYLTQILDGVYQNPDKRAYPLSSYSYMIIPTKAESNVTTAKGATLGAFTSYFLCEGQQQAATLGYSPLPINLVKAGLEQVARIPGVAAKSVDIKKCNNPTFSKDGTNTLAKQAPYPASCDKVGQTVCGVTAAADTTTTGKGGSASGSKGGSSSSSAGSGSSGGTTTDATGTDAGTGTGATTSDGTTVASGTTTNNVSSASTVQDGTLSCDADSGACTAVAAQAVAVDSDGWGTQQSFMAAAVALAVGIVILPPVVAALARRRRR